MWLTKAHTSQETSSSTSGSSSLDKHANSEMYFQTFLSEGVLEIIYQKSTEYNEFNRDIYVDEMTIPDLEIIANKISKELGKDPKYSKEEKKY